MFEGDTMQKHQNIYDNGLFFEGYKSIRERKDNYNILLEQPAMSSLLPDLSGKNVLDLGCGYGENAGNFIERGASSVVAVDISEKMLEVAMRKNADGRIKYLNMSMTDIDTLGMKFDFVYSSLAFHYIEDFVSFSRKIYDCLNPGGKLLFSQEHPITTATVGGKHYYTKDEFGVYKEFTFSDYGEPGERNVFWLVDGVVKYHRRFSDVINALISAGFKILRIEEPLPSEEALKIRPTLQKKEQVKPTFLIVLSERESNF